MVPETDSTVEASDASEPAALRCARVFPTRRDADDHGLAVLAMGLPYWSNDSAEGAAILVEAQHLKAVREEFMLYDAANANWPPRRDPLPPSRVRIPWLTPLAWAAIVAWVFHWQAHDGARIVAAGSLDAQALFHGAEWWRPFTALFLHADAAHLAGNLVFGVFVFANVIAAAGGVRGWLAIGVAAFFANVATAAAHHATGTVSYGASTAIFAALGWLTGDAVAGGWRAGGVWRSRRVLVPLAAGAVLLAWLGGGGVRTDVVAHVAGFAVGLVVGLGQALVVRRRQTAR